MKNRRILIAGAGLLVVLAMFVGCGGRAGEKEYGKAIKAWEAGNLVLARTRFEKAISRLSGNAKKSTAFNDLGLVLWQMGEAPAAADAFKKAANLSDATTEATLNLAIAQFHAGDLDAARLTLDIYLGDHPGNPTAQALAGMIAAKKRDWASAVRMLTETAAKNRDNPAAQNALALAELNHGQNAAAVVSKLKRIVADHPGYAPALYNLGTIHDQWLRDPDAAIGHYRDYLQKAGPDGSHVEAARQALARLTGQPAATPAKADLDAALRYMTEGARLHGEKKFAEAVAQFQRAAEADPNNKNAFYNMGMACFELQRFVDAEAAFDRAVRLDPRYGDARYMLAYALLRQKKWDAAEREAKALSTTDSKRRDELLQYISSIRN